MAFRKNYVFILAGQSNALGTGSDMDLTASPTYDNYISYGGGEVLGVRYCEMSACGADYPVACVREIGWKRLECTSPTGNKVFGPEISLGFDLNARIGIGTTEDANVWIIKCATGNTNMDDWAPTTYVGDARLYLRMQQFYAARVLEITNNPGTPGQVIYGGMLWCQGEADGNGSEATSLAHEALTQEFITAVGSDFGVGGEPIAQMRLGTDQTITFKANIVSGQNDLATANSNVTNIDTDALTVNAGSPPHWDEAGYLIIGSAAEDIITAHWGW